MIKLVHILILLARDIRNVLRVVFHFVAVRAFILEFSWYLFLFKAVH